ncbi:sulfite exporter TauE/SafE family protein [Desulfomonile tiedjei]|uniref:Probable membrane transporter protein n=1 Tax=Desulfomonile tiedjei (strain ATCC 49306 / DSM 6799 / DCB-1) TaxID=706587 RepID=I4C500_DESTA|nr:sulfite exporter TauE/SafE family protein [Desulfomonile tiedjei]AFM24641.1 putative permease [Desulfomonile tiedjei DSM 6799]
MTETTLFSAERFVGYVALGFGTGLYGTLIGAGGGFVLMPILLLLFPKESPEQLTSISLAVVFFNALGGSEAYALMRRIDYRSGLMFAAATIPGAILGALNTGYVPRTLFDAVFGILLVAGAAFLLIRTNKRESVEVRHYQYKISRHLVEANGVVFDYSFNPLVGIGLSFVVGYVSSFLGIGGGIIHVPAMTYFLNFPVHVATATSHFVLSIMAFTGTMTHVVTGTFPHNANLTLSLAIGALLGAPLGAHLSGLIRGNWIIRGLALALIVVGLRILAMAI